MPTILHSLVHPVLALSTPLVLRTKFMIDSEISPTAFSLAKFCSSTVALFVNLPLETVLRRGQVAILSQPEYVRAVDDRSSPARKPSKRSSEERTPDTSNSLEPIVPPGKYEGVLGTMHTIVYDEGSRALPILPIAKSKGASKRGKPRVAESVYRRGQGVEGLWRGWKVSWWGLVGLWGAAVVGGGGDGEF